jgi:hypothetical protein
MPVRWRIGTVEHDNPCLDKKIQFCNTYFGSRSKYSCAGQTFLLFVCAVIDLQFNTGAANTVAPDLISDGI